MIHHKKLLPTLMVRYKSRLRIPFTFGIHAKHFNNHEDLFRLLTSRVESLGILRWNWYSPDWIPALSYVLIIAAVGLGYYLNFYSTQLFYDYMRDDFDYGEFHRIYEGIPLALISVLIVMCVGLALGLLSGFHRSSPRPFLAGWLVMMTKQFPDPMIHWLVWYALFSILMAIQQTYIILPPPSSPSLSEMLFAHNLVSLMPAFAGASYVLGVVLGCWRAKGKEVH